MFNKLSLILMICCLAIVAKAQHKSDNWFPVMVDGKAGYIDRNGKVVLEPKYDGASQFSEGLARVSVGRDTIISEGFSQGFIDENGTVVIQPQWDVVSYFSEGLAAVGFDQTKTSFKLGNKTLYTSASHPWYRWGFIDKNGKVIIDTKFSDVSEFRDGIAVANTDPHEPKYGFIDRKGNWVIQPQFEHASQFSEGLALVFVKGKYGFIDKTGKIVIRPRFTSARDFSEGVACVRIGGDVIKPTGMSISNHPGKHAFIDKNGKIVISLKNASCRSFSEGLASFEEYGKYGEGFIDHTGRVVIKPNGGGQSDFSEGLRLAILDGGFAWIDKAGKVAIKSPFAFAEDFRNGLASVADSLELWKANWGYIDKSGTVIWKPSR